jgi:hypothetical protein
MPTSVRYPPVADSHKRILFERGPREDGCALKTREIVSWQALRDIVVRNDGSLSGYRWGVERKRVLIDREASMI